MNVADQLPRIFQANTDRFYQRVIIMTLQHLPTHETLETGEAANMDEFLARCAAQVENHTANEATKAFALTLDGMFERQLTRWTSQHGQATKKFEETLNAAARIGLLDLAKAGMADDICELHLVANVVRHGDGPSCDKLKAKAPQLWDCPDRNLVDLAPSPVPASEDLRVRRSDLHRYVRAITRFWGHVDPLPGAVLEPPY